MHAYNTFLNACLLLDLGSGGALDTRDSCRCLLSVSLFHNLTTAGVYLFCCNALATA